MRLFVPAIYGEGGHLHGENEAKTVGTFARVRRLLGEDKVERMDAPSLGADDFAFFCQKAPSCYFNVGCRGDGQGDEQVLHSALFAPDEGCMRVALEILCLIAGEDK